jgi:hypothetical protein
MERENDFSIHRMRHVLKLRNSSPRHFILAGIDQCSIIFGVLAFREHFRDQSDPEAQFAFDWSSYGVIQICRFLGVAYVSSSKQCTKGGLHQQAEFSAGPRRFRGRRDFQ